MSSNLADNCKSFFPYVEYKMLNIPVMISSLSAGTLKLLVPNHTPSPCQYTPLPLIWLKLWEALPFKNKMENYFVLLA